MKSISPGLRGTSYPGLPNHNFPLNPERVESTTEEKLRRKKVDPSARAWFFPDGGTCFPVRIAPRRSLLREPLSKELLFFQQWHDCFSSRRCNECCRRSI